MKYNIYGIKVQKQISEIIYSINSLYRLLLQLQLSTATLLEKRQKGGDRQ